ncbi:protein trichome birefringence-like 3 isoform X2 [Panicum virgatum]|uniref:Trichome birefringence-like N-terminal domain-containing protein n=3 Tax=Panicum virgatum TaxID=38727 RepID=A0A8T0NWE1_PANVG|nr:protein trichome birefringence-like 3 isoform X2 [Panicum virgatum]KAG2552689.1 hypothetical protein PVAP13_9KG477700 [Panicum virgatum]
MVQVPAMKRVKGRAPLSVVVAIIGGLALAGIIFTEDLRSLTEIMDKKKEKQEEEEKRTSSLPARARMMLTRPVQEATPAAKEAFDPRRCSTTEGYWAYNWTKRLPYTDQTCPFVDRQISCQRNGRPDSDYLYWDWHLDGCTLPRFDPAAVLEKLRGKRMLFVGDSLQMGQWLSFVCLVNSALHYSARTMERTTTLSVFTATEYNATIEFYWAPFLVEANSDRNIRLGAGGRVLHVDAVELHAKHWEGADILVFDSYVWWMSGSRIKAVWGAFGDDGYEELDAWVAFRLGLKTWANWVDANIDPNATRVFFMSISTTHMRSEDWGRDGGIRCYNETWPITRRGYWGSGADRRMMEVMSDVVGRMRVPVTLLNVTQLTEHRADAHVSVYTETGGELLTAAQRADPRAHADCIHWCLPGVPDTWNQILYAHL